MNTKEMIEVMQAYVDGNEIEWKCKYADDSEWKIYYGPVYCWDWLNIKYRIKKESEYVPFEWNDREQLRGKWVGLKEKNEEYLITGFELTRSAYVFFNEECVSFRELFEQYEFLDGSPCGKLEEE